jgi:hypothetical protein
VQEKSAASKARFASPITNLQTNKKSHNKNKLKKFKPKSSN